ncbi:hypothetical protein KKA17_08145 [bacterium]|nr:hypothetical protein [bacterium]
MKLLYSILFIFFTSSAFSDSLQSVGDTLTGVSTCQTITAVSHEFKIYSSSANEYTCGTYVPVFYEPQLRYTENYTYSNSDCYADFYYYTTTACAVTCDPDTQFKDTVTGQCVDLQANQKIFDIPSSACMGSTNLTTAPESPIYNLTYNGSACVGTLGGYRTCNDIGTLYAQQCTKGVLKFSCDESTGVPVVDTSCSSDTKPSAIDNFTNCDSIKPLADGVDGLQYVGLNSHCTDVAYFNSLFDGDSHYVTSTDATLCKDINHCLVMVTSCASGLTFSAPLNKCVDPLKPKSSCVKTQNSYISSKNGICQENFTCEDGSVYDNTVVDCPADNSATPESDQTTIKQALQEYGAATADNQIKTQELLENTNTLLNDLNSKTSQFSNTNHSDLSKIETAINTNSSDLNNALSTTNGKLGAVSTTLDVMSNNIANINNGLSSSQETIDYSSDGSMIDDIITTVNDAVNSFKSDVSSAIDEINAKKSLVENGFVINATKSRVTTCPTSYALDFGNGMGTQIHVDYCEAFSGFYDSGYLISYIGIVASSLSFILF